MISGCLNKDPSNSFKVLCGCHALERFLHEEKRLTILEENIKNGLMRVQKVTNSPHESKISDQQSLSNQDEQL